MPLSHQHSEKQDGYTDHGRGLDRAPVASKVPPTGVHFSTLVKRLPFHLAAWVNTHLSTQVSGPPFRLYTFVNAHLPQSCPSLKLTSSA